MRKIQWITELLLVLLFGFLAYAQQPLAPTSSMPPLINFVGVLTDPGGKPLTGSTAVTFSLYGEQRGGAALWMESQTVLADSAGHYSVNLGSGSSLGLPSSLFSTAEPRWLGVRVQNQEEYPRVVLVSVPYALKAMDAETIGGLPPAAFLRSGTPPGELGTTIVTNSSTPSLFPSVGGSGTTDYVPLWTSSTTLGNSKIFQTGGKVGIGTTTPTVALDVNGRANVSKDYRIGGTTVLSIGGSNDNIALGAGALVANTTGLFNTSAGNNSMATNTVGNANSAYGSSSLHNNIGGLGNTAVGSQSLFFNSGGNDNTGIGYSALEGNVSGNGNTGVGNSTDSYGTDFSENTAVGDQALANTLGNNNTAVGAFSIAGASGGFLEADNNTALGYSALNSLIEGSGNIAVGYLAGSSISSASNNIDIGNSGASTDAGTVRIGTSGTQTSFFVAGVRGVTTSHNDAIPVMIDSTGQLGTVSSALRFKTDIQNMGNASSDLMRLRPVTFRYKTPFADGTQPIQYGLIAEEVERVYPDLVAHSADGQIETVKYQVLDSMLLNELQRQQAQIQELREQLSQMQAALASMSRATGAR